MSVSINGKCFLPTSPCLISPLPKLTFVMDSLIFYLVITGIIPPGLKVELLTTGSSSLLCLGYIHMVRLTTDELMNVA